MNKNGFISVNKIGYIFFFLFSVIANINCGLSFKDDVDNIKMMEVYYKGDLFNKRSMKLTEIRDSVDIFSNNRFIIYRIGNPYEKTKVEMDSAGDIKKEILLQAGIRFSYFVCKIGNDEGFLYDSINSDNYKRENVKKFIKSKISFAEEMFYNENDSLIHSVKMDKKLFETYIPKAKIDNSYPDTSILMYSDLEKKISYSLSPKLDSLKKMKLMKVIFIYCRRKYSSEDDYIPRREFVFEIREKSDKIPDEVSSLFNKVGNML